MSWVSSNCELIEPEKIELLFSSSTKLFLPYFRLTEPAKSWISSKIFCVHIIWSVESKISSNSLWEIKQEIIVILSKIAKIIILWTRVCESLLYEVYSSARGAAKQLGGCCCFFFLRKLCVEGYLLKDPGAYLRQLRRTVVNRFEGLYSIRYPNMWHSSTCLPTTRSYSVDKLTRGVFRN